MDDLSSELDLERRKQLVHLLAEREGQVWITTTQPNFLSDLPRGRIARFYVENGIVTPEQKIVFVQILVFDNGHILTEIYIYIALKLEICYNVRL